MVGTIFTIVRYLEEHRSPFVVSRLIMLSGVNVRKFTADREDEPEALHKVVDALPAIVSATELEDLRRIGRW
jgi:hypothetical protein